MADNRRPTGRHACFCSGPPPTLKWAGRGDINEHDVSKSVCGTPHVAFTLVDEITASKCVIRMCVLMVCCAAAVSDENVQHGCTQVAGTP